jgi:mannose-6-phosphate isomerase
MKMRPAFRHGTETPWGGEGLRELFCKAIPDDLTGESLEVSALPGLESVVENGELAGRTLGEVYEKYRGRLTGLPDEAGFPLLVKLLDAREMLSVQVHPGDAYAGQRHGKRGKTEAWVVLDAPPFAQLVLGLKEGADLKEAIRRGRWRMPSPTFRLPPAMSFTFPTAWCTRWAAASECTRSSSLRT